MFKPLPHSVPAPRLCKKAAIITRKVKENGGNFKTLVYGENKRIVGALYALVIDTLHHISQIDFLLKRSQLLEKEPRFDPWLARVLIANLFWGTKKVLIGESIPVKTILAYEQILRAHFADVHDTVKTETKVIKPRYVRVNTLKITVDDAIDLFKNEGRTFVQYEDLNNYEGFLSQVTNLGPNEFMLDAHIMELLIFPPNTKFFEHSALLNGLIVLQDKASLLPAYCLKPTEGSTVLDTCAAPGMKTSQLAAMINNNGLVYAVDFDRRRLQALVKLITQMGVTCVDVINKDVLTLTGEDYPNVEYVLVDPSCSGSGIIDRLEFDYTEKEDRLTKLAGLQIKILKHAFQSFPKAKRVVYSTCSINEEENEAVVQEVLQSTTDFQLVPASAALRSKWHSYGSPKFGYIGKYCMRTKPEVDLTNGFFVAVFERVQNNCKKRKNKNRFETDDESLKNKKRKVLEDESRGELRDNIVQKEAKKRKSRDEKVGQNVERLEIDMVATNRDGIDRKDAKKISEDAVLTESQGELRDNIVQKETKKRKNRNKNVDQNVSVERPETVNTLIEIGRTNRDEIERKHPKRKKKISEDAVLTESRGELRDNIAQKEAKKRKNRDKSVESDMVDTNRDEIDRKDAKKKKKISEGAVFSESQGELRDNIVQKETKKGKNRNKNVDQNVSVERAERKTKITEDAGLTETQGELRDNIVQEKATKRKNREKQVDRNISVETPETVNQVTVDGDIVRISWDEIERKDAKRKMKMSEHDVLTENQEELRDNIVQKEAKKRKNRGSNVSAERPETVNKLTVDSDTVRINWDEIEKKDAKRKMRPWYKNDETMQKIWRKV